MRSIIAALRTLVLPFGATSGRRIVLDGVNGEILVYDVDGSRRLQLGGVGSIPQTAGNIEMSTGDTDEAEAGEIGTDVISAGGAAQRLQMRLGSPMQDVDDAAVIMLRSRRFDGTGNAQVILTGFANLDHAEIDLNAALLTISDGANLPMGTATLAAGTVTVNNSVVTASSRIFLSRQAAGGTLGHLSVTRVAGTSFTINSSSATDTSTVAWLLIEPGS